MLASAECLDFSAIDANRRMREARATSAQLKSLADTYHEQLARAEEQLSIYQACDTAAYKIKLGKYLASAPSGKATAIICANDWHIEECVDPGTINGLNEFNLEIADKRLDQLWNKAILLTDSSRKLSNIRDAVVWLGGDLINGQLHAESAEKNFLGPTEAVLWVMERAEKGLRFLLANGGFERILVVTSFGNHGRTTEKRRISTGYRHSWEWAIYNMLARVFAGEKRITFKIEKGSHNLVPVQGHWVRFHHGDDIKFGGGVGGIAIPLRKKIAQWNKQHNVALDVLGHFHQFIWDWYFVMSGCVVGYNAYANSIGAEPQPPTQAFIVMDRERRVVEAKPIFVE